MDSKYDDLTASGSEDEEDVTPKENVDVQTINSSPNKGNRIHKNNLERKRKGKVKLYITQLSELIPNDFMPLVKKKSRNSILEHAVAYMTHLKEQSSLFLSNNGSQVQTNEIERLKRELSVVCDERDKYEQMVNQAAVVTSKIVTSMSAHKPTESAVPAGTVTSCNTQVIANNNSDRIPGQGLIITQSGQAYYVNEQGVPVAQGMAPMQLLSDSMLAKSSPALTTSSSAVSHASSTQSTSLTTALTTGPPATDGVAIAGGVPKSLVPLPGHTGQLPGAIILPNGQIIPMVNPAAGQNSLSENSTSSTAAGHQTDFSSTVTAVTNTTVVSTNPSSSEISCSTSNTSSIMLIGSQQPVSAAHFPPATDASRNQLGRKIMPKPAMFGQVAPIMTPFTLAPLPMPACSSSVAPTMFSNEGDGGKKRRSRKKKVKVTSTTSTTDVLATAAAPLLTAKIPDEASAPNENRSALVTDSHTVAPSAVFKSPPILSNPLHGVRARRTRKRKIKEAQKAVEAKKSQIFSASAKQHSPHHEGSAPTSDIATSGSSKSNIAATKADELGDGARDDGSLHDNKSQAIEFDPNDLDNILDQVENIEGATTDHGNSQSHTINSGEAIGQTDYQVLTGDEEIGPVFTTSNLPGDTSPKNPTSRNLSPEPPTLQSDSYLVGSLTKNTEQPVDHRRQQSMDGGKSGFSNVTNGGGESNMNQRSQQRTVSVDANIASVSPAQSSPAMNEASVSPQESLNVPSPTHKCHTGANEHDHTQSKVRSVVSVKPLSVANSREFLQDAFSKTSPVIGRSAEHSLKSTVLSNSEKSQSLLMAAEKTYSAFRPPVSLARSTAIDATCSTTATHRFLQANEPPVSSALPSVGTNCVTAAGLVPTPQNSSVYSAIPPHYLTNESHSLSVAQPQHIATNAGPHRNFDDTNLVPEPIYSSSHKGVQISGQTAMAPWSPAKDVEKRSSKSTQGDRHSLEPHLFTSSQSAVSAQQSPSVSAKNLISSSRPVSSLQSFSKEPYHYTQFSTSTTSGAQADGFSDNQKNVSSLRNKLGQSQPQAPLEQVHSSNVPRTFSHDSSTWTKVSQVSGAPSAPGSLYSQNADQTTFPSQGHSQDVRAKAMREQRDSARSNRYPSLSKSGDLPRPPDPGYSHSYDNAFGINHSSGSHHGVSVSVSSSTKSSVFSTESILTKRKSSTDRRKDAGNEHGTQFPDSQCNAPPDGRLLLEKDKTFMTSQPYAAPFNVNFFSTPQSTTSGSLRHPSFPDPPFTFSLTSTSGPTFSTNAYDKFSPHLSFASQYSRHTHANHRSTSSSGTVPLMSGAELSQPPSHSYPDQFSVDSSHVYPIKQGSHISNPLQQVSTMAKSKQMKAGLDTAKDLSNMPYSFSSQAYGIIPLSSNQPAEAQSANLLNSQQIYNNPPVSIGIPFQHPGFSALAPNDFGTQASPARFNINNIFREKSQIDASFKLPGNNPSTGTLYPPPSNLYHNPMGIFGNAPNFDLNRAPSVAAFAASNPNLPGFCHPFDFNMPSQS